MVQGLGSFKSYIVPQANMESKQRTFADNSFSQEAYVRFHVSLGVGTFCNVTAQLTVPLISLHPKS